LLTVSSERTAVIARTTGESKARTTISKTLTALGAYG
jgi:hypothetical protein